MSPDAREARERFDDWITVFGWVHEFPVQASIEEMCDFADRLADLRNNPALVLAWPIVLAEVRAECNPRWRFDNAATRVPSVPTLPEVADRLLSAAEKIRSRLPEVSPASLRDSRDE